MFEKIKNLFKTTSEENTIIKEAESIVKDKVYSFKVAGISYHYDELEKLIRSLLKDGVIEKFNGYTNKDIIEDGDGFTIYEHQYIKGGKLEPYEYEGKDAIKILLPDYNEKWYELGNVPKKDLKQVIEILDKNIVNIEFEITGGKAKYVNDDDNKPYIVEKEYDYGVNIYITYKDA